MTEPVVDGLLQAARRIVTRVRYCMVVTPAADGGANARVVQPFPPDEDWSVSFVTSARSRKADEIHRTGRLTLAYQHDPEGAYVSLVGHARLTADPATKARIWSPGLDEWFPAGPDDPDVVVVRLATERIELWSYAAGIMPEPRGQRAAVVQRAAGGGTWTAAQV
jgi:general stress protein 26